MIIGILSAAALPQYELAVAKARFSRFLPLMRNIDAAQQVYYMANGEYSKDLHNLDIAFPPGAETETSTRFVYEDFECFLGAANLVSLYCRDNKYNFPRLEKYFSSQSFLCWSGPNDRLGARVCKALAGKSVRDGVSTDGALGDYYYF